MKCPSCNKELLPLNSKVKEGEHFCGFCRKAFILNPSEKKSRKRQTSLEKQKTKHNLYSPRGYKTSCSSANYNREKVVQGGLCMPK